MKQTNISMEIVWLDYVYGLGVGVAEMP
jgi:hypothetical protein